jgi:hypothetical protein
MKVQNRFLCGVRDEEVEWSFGKYLSDVFRVGKKVVLTVDKI